MANIGNLIKSGIEVQGNRQGALTDYPLVGRAVASTKTYELYKYTEYHGHNTDIEVRGGARKGQAIYPVCGTEYLQGGNQK